MRLASCRIEGLGHLWFLGHSAPGSQPQWTLCVGVLATVPRAYPQLAGGLGYSCPGSLGAEVQAGGGGGAVGVGRAPRIPLPEACMGASR